MPVTTTYMSLVTWPAPSDFFDHTALAANFTAIDAHDHTATKGTQVPTGGILDGAVTPPKVSGLHVADVYTNRPTATSALNGVRFFATDKLMEWQCVSAVWTLVHVLAPEVVALPASPIDQQECIYVVDATNGVKWHLRYRSASASTYKWEFIGGPPLFAEVTTAETTASATFTGLTTAGPSVTVPLAGDFFVQIGCRISSGTGNADYDMSYKIGAAAALVANQCGSGTSTATNVSRSRAQAGLAASTVLLAQYAASAFSGTFADRFMQVAPRRVG